MKIACIGDNCIDSYDETGKYYPGGNAVNVAVYLRRLGLESSYVGAVGNDENGERLRRALLEKGVDVSRLRVIDGPTAVSHVRMLDGDRVFGAYEEGVMADFRPTQEDVEFLCIHDLAAATLWGHAESILPELRRRGIPTAFDASESPLCETARIALPHTSLFFFSDSNSHTGRTGQSGLRRYGILYCRRRSLPCGGYPRCGRQLHCRLPGCLAFASARPDLHDRRCEKCRRNHRIHRSVEMKSSTGKFK